MSLGDAGHVDLSPLTPRQREVVEMHYESRLSFAAIALLLGISKATAQTHHERALDKLLDAMSYGQDL